MQEVFMEIRNLESFIQVAELGSFTKAAESLGYTQSSVSTQIRQLENELGIPLFERINHSVKLTEKGKEILSLAHQLFRTADAIKKTADTGCSSIILNSFISFFPESLWN